MEPHDDPEERIRELERPLADLARTAELGTQPYATGGPQPYGDADPAPYGSYDAGAPPPYGAHSGAGPQPFDAAGASPYGVGGYHPPPAPGYGQPYFPASQPPPGGFRAWWLVLAGLAMSLVVVGGAVAFFLAGSSTEGDIADRPDSSPNVLGGGDRIDRIPGVVPTTPPNSPPELPGLPGEASVVSAEPGDTVSVYGFGQDKTIECDNCIVTVSGVSNTVTIKGNCADLTVSGAENSVTVDSADAIGASGFENKVIYRSGTPQIDKAGVANVVEQG